LDRDEIEWNKSNTGAADEQNPELYLQRLFLPLRQDGDEMVLALADASPENIAWLRAAYGGPRFIFVTKQALVAEVQSRFASRLTEDAIFDLARAMPALSAQRVITPAQCFGLLLLALFLGTSLGLGSVTVTYAAVAAMSCIAWMSVLLRAVLALLGANPRRERRSIPAAANCSLPLYSIIVPLYREAHMVPGLARTLLELEYPQDQLQILFAVEDDDIETVSAVETLSGTVPFEIVRVPPSFPRTKPKAANFALSFVRGEFVVVFDAEDRPERDQLRKAVSEFRRRPRTVACLQARLAFDNCDRWITKQAALDYRLWFELLLQGLDKIGVPMPLGGTSNHFRTAVLRCVHAWDPFNVTEDADLGIRLAALGHRVSMLDSTTFEEAPDRIGAWLKQRSRWLKGYMQTWLVHSRCTSQFVGQAGIRGILAFHLFIGGTVLAALLNPVLWAICIAAAAFGRTSSEYALGYVSAGGIIASNGVLTILAMTGSAWRSDGKFSPHGIMVPLYWILISVAAYRGLWQLITNPFHWEKTTHGVSDHA
jgi:cellulose synthase/poly-beta-1,6-N-acetylglucosamine synthase-like glycosyltransferase